MMLSIITPNISLTNVISYSRIAYLSNMLMQHDIKDDIVALYIDISIEGVLLLLAAINLGLKVALCPLREPALVLNKWLHDLGIKQVFASTKKLSGIDASWIDLDSSLLASSSFKPNISKVNNFISIIRTSGTMSQAKNVYLSDEQHRASARAVNDYFHINDSSVLSLSLPLYHVSGLSMVYRSLLSSSSLYLAPNYEDLCYGINHHLITHISLVPMQLKRLLHEGISMSHLKAVIIGGDHCPESLVHQALKSNIALYTTYGLSETASMIMVRDCRYDQETILPHAHLHIDDNHEIWVKGESLFLGYLENGVLHQQKGMFATGDIKLFKEHGHIIVRKGNVIISGGFNIALAEIEEVLDAHPLITNAIVIGIDDERLSKRPLAFIKSDPKLLLPDLKAYLHKRLADYKIPHLFLPWPNHAPMSLKKPRPWFLHHQAELIKLTPLS